MRYMPINSGSVLHGIWHDLRLRELKDKLEEMHVMYELSHKKGASMSNKKFVSFQDLTLSRNELGLVVVSGLPTGDSTLIVVPPIGSVQTDKIGLNDLSIDERCALWALVYGQTVSERPTFKPVSEPSHGGIPVKSPKSDKVVIKFLRDSVPAVSPQLAELLSLAGMTQRSAEAEDNEDTDTNQERGEAEMTTLNREIIARLKEVGKKLAELHRDVDAFPDQAAPTEEAAKAPAADMDSTDSTSGKDDLYPGHDFKSLLPWFAAAYTNDRTAWPTVTEHVINRTIDIFGSRNLQLYSHGKPGKRIGLKHGDSATFRILQTLREEMTYHDVFSGVYVINDDCVRTIWFMDMMTEFSHLPPSAEPFGPELRVPPYHPLMRWRLGDALVDAIYGSQVNEAFDPKNLGMRTRGMLMTANTNLNGRYTVDKHFSCRLKKAEK